MSQLKPLRDRADDRFEIEVQIGNVDGDRAAFGWLASFVGRCGEGVQVEFEGLRREQVSWNGVATEGVEDKDVVGGFGG